MAITGILCATIAGNARAQSADGFSRIVGKHITIVTDLPMTDSKTAAELQELPEVFEQAFAFWCEQFSVDRKSTQDWKVTLYVMLERERFRQAGLIPKDVPEFPNGWQYKDELWVMEQVSPYYRRHLILHEGTHWFMYRKYGFYDAPWLAEGMSELLGTHHWLDKKLTMGVIPANQLEVPFWGRIKIIREQSAAGTAPSFEEILRYSKTAHQSLDAYAWSWAMIVFLKNHPDTRKIFEDLLRQQAMNSLEVEKWLRQRLNDRLPQIRTAWRSFVTELDYGYSAEPGMLRLSENIKKMSANDGSTISVSSKKGWQATGLTVNVRDELSIKASGKYSVAQQPKPWICTPAGVTLEYYRGQPLGKPMMVVLSPQIAEAAVELVDSIPIGDQANWTATEAGELFFRINESAGMLSDNEGEMTVEVSLK
ncbi:MAG: hypothetical protein U0930_20400 [Pirellulales bacterium]